MLGAALRAGLYLPYGCKTGGCSTCKMRLVDGGVDDRGSSLALTPDEHAEGWFLPCVARPVEDCIVDVGGLGLSETDFLGGDRAVAFRTELVQNQRLTYDVHALRLRLIEPQAMRFAAGQFVNVSCPVRVKCAAIRLPVLRLAIASSNCSLSAIRKVASRACSTGDCRSARRCACSGPSASCAFGFRTVPYSWWQAAPAFRRYCRC